MSRSGTTDPLVAATGAAELVAALSAVSATVATAESLTAGLLSATIAGVPGASAVLRGGVVVYATDLKHSLAGVDAAVLVESGPVAGPTAAQLATGARRTCGADWGVALTGVAGPAAQDGRPPGLVYLGVAGPDGVEVRQLALSGDRWTIRLGAVTAAIAALRDRVGNLPPGGMR
ncbi:CinA family protein [Skermania piniformis]|uniref:Nicotinamide-nucleotide amidohydrolase family protein n=1 Tax=Skermania pinensis TaxID=39122 RepID=A0ABX8S467_9ACTN|nr:CinA family protein [Skermania piniformis]QXQ12599.1 nicotinamide-nucleotide amidohydrolase family protein [Skermania piniformis]